MSELLRAQGLRQEFVGGRKRVVTPLQDVNLVVQSGEFIAITGPSGCGKTTLLLACGGLRRPTAGTVHVNGIDMYGLPTARRTAFRSTNIGFVFQTLALIPYLSLWENLIVVPGACRPSVDRWLDQLGLGHRRDHKPTELSQGEQQRAAVARALVHEPRLVLADEPTGNLDAENGRLVFAALSNFAENEGAVLVVTHDLSLAQSGGCSRVLRLFSGNLTESTP